MLKLCRVLAAVLALTFVVGSFSSSAVAAPKHPEDVIPDQFIVVLEDTVANVPGAAKDLTAGNNAAVLYTYEHAFKGFAVKMPDEAISRLEKNQRVAYIIPDEKVTLDSIGVHAPLKGIAAQSSQTLPTGIDRIDGELSSTVSGNGSGSVSVDVAVLDTGIDIDHPDLNVVGGKNCQSGSSYDDAHGHGTHVAGTIAAKDNSIGVVGVAPGARLYAVKVLDDSGSGTTSSIICGIDWVTANASTIEVANMSLGGQGFDSSCGGSDTYHNAICKSVNAGVTYAVAAGNSSQNAQFYRPATYAEVITVSALADFNGQPGGGAASTCRTDVDDTFANFSNYGSDVDLIAPGVCIYSTYKDGGYSTSSGTSMASPHVAGAAALYKANNPSATPAQVKTALQNAGNTNWNNSDDYDSTKEKLLNVDNF